jgi:hypothetical protein
VWVQSGLIAENCRSRNCRYCCCVGGSCMTRELQFRAVALVIATGAVWMIGSCRSRRPIYYGVQAWSHSVTTSQRSQPFSSSLSFYTPKRFVARGPAGRPSPGTLGHVSFLHSAIRSSSPASAPYKVGDAVLVTPSKNIGITIQNDTDSSIGQNTTSSQPALSESTEQDAFPYQGFIQDVRGRGWYVVQVNSPQEKLIKVRGTSLQKIGDRQEKQSNNALSSDNTSTKSPMESTVVEVATNATNSNSTSTIRTARIRTNPDIDIPVVVVVSDLQRMRPFASAIGNSTVVPHPTIYNLDAALKDATDPVQDLQDQMYLQQAAHHHSVNKWVVFTDLHCSPASLTTTLQVLKQVHALAVEREAGVLFLGDWWHYRGTLRVDCLNAVLQALSTWHVPMILIPGNHDQVTLGGQQHALTPLLQAYRVPTNQSNTTVPGPLIFTFPTLFQNALFIPHIRDVATLESILQSPTAQRDSVAIFCHADIWGAFHNDWYQSDAGVDPQFFPPLIPIYSGHFHKPHRVISGDVTIEYLGSPYEVSLAEAQQAKSLAVVDSSEGWQCVERIPIRIGRRHFPVRGIDEFLNLSLISNNNPLNGTDHSHDIAKVPSSDKELASLVAPGDRVVVSLNNDEMDAWQQSYEHPIHKHAHTLRQSGVAVEIRLHAPAALAPRMSDTVSFWPNSNNSDAKLSWTEAWSAEATWSAFLDEQVQRKIYSEARCEEMKIAGVKLLHSLEEDESVTTQTSTTTASPVMKRLELESLTVQGFGPFRDSVSYPLANRGLVLLRGSNKDGGSDSNGSGKTSLAMSALWALTGSLDPRPLQDNKVADLVNDDAPVSYKHVLCSTMYRN